MYVKALGIMKIRSICLNVILLEILKIAFVWYKKINVQMLKYTVRIKEVDMIRNDIENYLNVYIIG